MADNFFQNVANNIANTEQSIQSTFDYLKEFLQDVNILVLTTMVLLSAVLYVSMIIFIVRLGLWVRERYKDNFNSLIKLLFDFDGNTKSEFK